MKTLRIALIALVAVGFGAIAQADIIGGTIISGAPGAAFVTLTVPLSNPFGAANSVGNDNFQSINLFGFNESQNTQVVGSPLALDVGASPLAVGTIVASHYIFFDPTTGDIDGTVDFDSAVLGILTSTSRLLLSDYLANTGVNYLNPALRGLEAGDSVTISGPNQIRFTTSAGTPGDYVRVLTEFSPGGAIPEPSSVILMTTILLGFGVAARKRFNRTS